MEYNNKFDFPVIAKWIITILVIALALYGVWYFRFLFGCIAIAIVLSFIGRPIMNFLEKIQFKNLRLNKTFSASITLIALLFVIGIIFYTLVPLIVSQAMSFSNIDIYQIADYYAGPIAKIEAFLHEYQLLSLDTKLETFISNKIYELFKAFNIAQLANTLINLSWNIALGFFIVIFITFFFLKDSYLLYNFINSITPDKYLDEVDHIINNSRRLITRYFIGLLAEILCMIILLSIGFYFAGFPSAILMAFLCGIMVILPYIGVFIGGAMGLTVCVTAYLSNDPNIELAPIIITFILIFTAVKLIDDFVLQPLIYSKSVKAHPLEIFIVILAAGQIGGIVGMMLAIPTYTFLRIIAKEFFNKSKFVQKLTKNI